MSPPAFPRFSNLPIELRSRIWECATVIHIQDMAETNPGDDPDRPDRLPPWFGNHDSWDEEPYQEVRRMLALHVNILDPYDGLKIRFEEDEFETFVDCISISAVCHEARICVAKYCQPLVRHVWFEYHKFPEWSFKPPIDGAHQPVVIRNLHCPPEADTLKHFFPRPRTLTIDKGRFRSAEHLVEIVSRFFGSMIQRLVLVHQVDLGDKCERAYWSESETSTIRQDGYIEVFLKEYPEGDLTLVHMTRHGKIYASESFWRSDDRTPSCVVEHLLKIREIVEASLRKLPQLEYIEVDLVVSGMEYYQRSSISLLYKRDVGDLIVTWSDPLRWPYPSWFKVASSDSGSHSPSLSP